MGADGNGVGGDSLAEGESGAPVLSDLPPPVERPAISFSGSPVPPQQRLFFYSSDEWELFVREWATGLSEDYVQIKQLGGPNDRGVDVAAFKTSRGFEDCWHCFQAKHYAEPLKLSEVLPEILKLLTNVLAGHYILPERYAFLAPRGCGASLSRMLSKPSGLQHAFLTSDLLAAQPSGLQTQLRELAGRVDFALFTSVEILDALDTHRRTPYFVARFGGPLAPRPAASAPPDALSSHETRYVSQLVEAYAEEEGSANFVPAELSTHPTVGAHFQRQRVAFYQAESLRLYARDSVPEGTFEKLQDDVYSGVIDVAESEHPSGMVRLRQVLTASGQLDLSSHTLITVSTLDDRKGICHQLANEDRLTWVRGQQ